MIACSHVTKCISQEYHKYWNKQLGNRCIQVYHLKWLADSEQQLLASQLSGSK